MKICVDTNILLYILKDEFPGYQEKFYKAFAENEKLIIPVIVYAELMPQFKGKTGFLDKFLSDHKIEVLPLDKNAVTKAAEAWIKYLKRKTRKKCSHCGGIIESKGHVLSDFYIGGFSSANCDFILTRDRGVYKKYFADIKGYEDCL